MIFKRNYLYTALSLAFAHNAVAGLESDTMTVWSSPVPAATTTVLNQETIQKLDKRNVAQALSVVPGVVLQKSGARNEQQVKVRGFDSRQVPVYFDGVPVYVPYDGNLDLGRFLTSDLASLEVSKGYSSLLQGPNQMGGAINITSKKPTKPLEASVGYRQGWSRSKTNAFDTQASLGASNDMGYIQLSCSRVKQDFLGLPRSVDNPIAGQNGKMINSAADDKRGIVKVGFTPRENDEYVFTYINQDGSKENPPYSGTSGQQSRYWQWPQYDKESYYYQGTTQLGDRYTLKSRLYRDTFENTLMMYQSLADLKNRKGNYSHYSDFTNGAGLQLAADVRTSDLLSFAVNWKDDVHRERGAVDAPFDRYKDRTWSLASEYQWAAADNLDVVAGISYDWRDSRQGMKHEKSGDITHYANNSQNAFNWQLMTKYHFANEDTLSLSFSDRTRFPTLKERYTTSKPAYNGQTVLVNPHLNPERAQTVDVTWNGTFTRDWGYDVSVYYNRVNDAILGHTIDANTLQNRNSGRVDYTGLDLGVKGRVTELLDLGLNYGLIHADVKQDEVGKVTDLPTHTLVAWMTFKPWEPLSLTLSQEARSSAYNSSDAKQRASGFTVTNLRADYDVGRGVSVNASVNNLFDTEYAYNDGFIEQGRNFWAGIACNTMAGRLEDDAAPALMHAQSRNGWFYRVLQEGEVYAGAAFDLLERPYGQWPLSRVQDTIFDLAADREALEAVYQIETLSSTWREQIRDRLALLDPR